MRSAPTASGHVIQESKGWGKIALGIVALIFFGPMLVATFAGALTDAAIPNAGDAADKLTCWPVQPACPPERLRQSSTAPTTVAPPQMTQSELEARMQAKSLGDGLAAARAATPAPQVDPRGGLPSIDGGGTGGIVGELPAVGGIVRALTQGGGLKALNP